MDQKLAEAARAGDVAMLHEILRNRSIALHSVLIASNEDTPLHIAALLGHLEFVKAVLDRNPALAREPNEHGYSPLHLAAAKGHIQVVEELLKMGSDLCLLRDHGGRMPLHVAGLKGRVEVLAKLMSQKPETVREVTNAGDTVLHLSVKANHLQVVEFLMGIEDDDLLNFRDEKGNTALHLATARKQIQTTILLLTTQKIDINATNKRGATALDVILELPREDGEMQLQQILLAAGGRLGVDSSSPQSHHVQNSTTPHFGQKKSWTGKQEDHNMWLYDTRNTLMVVATLIATITFQAALNPPGGYATEGDRYHKVGEVLIADYIGYTAFMVFDGIGLSASLCIILLLLFVTNLGRKLLMAILVRVMCVSIFATAMAYFSLLLLIVPSYKEDWYWQLSFLIAWIAIMVIAFSFQLVQLLVYLLEKLGHKLSRVKMITLFVFVLLGVAGAAGKISLLFGGSAH